MAILECLSSSQISSGCHNFRSILASSSSPLARGPPMTDAPRLRSLRLVGARSKSMKRRPISSCSPQLIYQAMRRSHVQTLVGQQRESSRDVQALAHSVDDPVISLYLSLYLCLYLSLSLSRSLSLSLSLSHRRPVGICQAQPLTFESCKHLRTHQNRFPAYLESIGH